MWSDYCFPHKLLINGTLRYRIDSSDEVGFFSNQIVTNFYLIQSKSNATCNFLLRIPLPYKTPLICLLISSPDRQSRQIYILLLWNKGQLALIECRLWNTMPWTQAMAFASKLQGLFPSACTSSTLMSSKTMTSMHLYMGTQVTPMILQAYWASHSLFCECLLLPLLIQPTSQLNESSIYFTRRKKTKMKSHT